MTMAGPITRDKDEDDFIGQGVRLRKALEQGQTAFENMLRAEGLKPRKAYYLVSIADAFEHSAVPREDLLSVGWTKLEMLRDRSREKDFPALLRQAHELPVPELRRVLSGKAPRSNRKVMNLSFSGEQHEIVLAAIEAFSEPAEEGKVEDRETALVRALQFALEANQG